MHLKSCFALFGTLLLLCSTAVAQDECATAASISEGDTAFDTTGATDSADPLVCVGGGLGAMSGDLWFTYVAPCDGDLLVSTCDQAFDTDLAMYSGGCGALTCEAGSGDAPGCAGFTSEIAAHPVTGGTTYHIRVGAWGAGDTGTGTLTVALTPAVPGDECACALPIGTGDTALDTTLATTSADALGCAGGGLGSMGSDLWFSYTPSACGLLTASTCDQAWDTDLTISSGGCGTLVCEAGSGDAGGCGGFTSEIAGHPVTAGTEYFIRVGSWSATVTGTGTLTLTLNTGDECNDPFPIAEGDTAYDNSCATTSADPLGCTGTGLGAMGSDLWYSYIPATDGELTVSTCDQGHDTDLALYSGSCGALACEAGSGDAPGCGGFTSEIIAHPVTAGTEYRIRVGSWSSTATGSGTVTVTLIVPEICDNGIDDDGDSLTDCDDPDCSGGIVCNPPDECIDAAAIALGDTDFSTVFATTSLDPLGCSGAGLGAMAFDIWYTYTAPADGLLGASTCDQAYDTDLALYSGGCGALTCEAGAGDTAGCAGFTSEIAGHPVTAGTEYHIRVGGWSATSGFGNGIITLTLDVYGDECATAITALEGDNALDTTAMSDSADPYDDVLCSTSTLGAMSNDVWYTFTSAVTGLMTVSTCDQAFDTDIVIYEGPCGGGTASQIGCDGDAPGCGGFTSQVNDVSVTAGTEYLIRVGAWGAGASGTGTVTITVELPCTDPTPGFTPDITTGIAPLDVSFANTSDDGGDPATTYDWDFGDGGTSSDVSPTHTFAAGSSDVTLTANGCGASITSAATTITAYDMGDSNCDGMVDLSDVLYVADWLFGAGPAPCCPNAANVNGDPNTDLGDVVYLLNYLFTMGPAPIYSGPGC